MNVLRVLALVTVAAGFAACSGGRVSLPGDRTGYSGDLRVRTASNGRSMVRVPLEAYVSATALAEFAPAAAERSVVVRMLEVQAITSRTFAAGHRGRHDREGFDFCATTHCQMYEPDRLRTSRWTDAVEEAVARTKGIVLWYDARPAEAVFHADCGGHTAAAADVWGGTGRRYLIGRPDHQTTHVRWEYSLSLAQARAALNDEEGTRVGRRLDVMEIVERDASGRADSVALRGEVERRVTGEQLRRALTRAFGARSIRSTLFDIRRSGDTITFSGRGFGHGVGLCQAGAYARLQKGATPDAVLQHYFPGTRAGRI